MALIISTTVRFELRREKNAYWPMVVIMGAGGRESEAVLSVHGYRTRKKAEEVLGNVFNYLQGN